MFNYRATEGTQATKPAALEINGDTVYIRKNIQQVTKTTEQGKVKVWSYKEAQVTKDEYIAQQVAIVNNLEQSQSAEDSADSVAELLLEQATQAEAISDLQDAVAEILLLVAEA